MQEYIELSGSHYDVNFKLGQMFATDAKNAVKTIDLSKFEKRIEEAIKFFKLNHPSIHTELQGRANGANISIQEYVAICSYEIWHSNQDKCTDLYFCNKNEKLILHNEDGNAETKLIKALCKYDDETIFDLACFDTLHGSTFTSNKFLSFSINHIYNDNFSFDGIPSYLIGRLIASCKNLAQVKKVLEEVSIWGSISINLFVNEENKMYSIEKIYDKFAIKEINETFFRTNHIVQPELAEHVKLPKTLNTSLTRFQVLQKKIKNVKTIEDAKRLMRFNNGKMKESVHQGKRTKATVMFGKDLIEFVDLRKKKAFNCFSLFEA